MPFSKWLLNLWPPKFETKEPKKKTHRASPEWRLIPRCLPQQRFDASTRRWGSAASIFSEPAFHRRPSRWSRDSVESASVGKDEFSPSLFTPNRLDKLITQNIIYSFFLASRLRETVRVSCAGFKEAPLEVPLFRIGGNIYIYKAGRSPSTALPCFSSRSFLSFHFFSFFVHMIWKEDDALFIPRLQLRTILFLNSHSSPPHTLQSKQEAVDQVSVCGVCSLERASFSRSSAHTGPAEGSQSQSI